MKGSATTLPLRYLLRPKEETGHPEMDVLSVYRDYGVIPKSSRDDNFNKTPPDLSRYQVVRKGNLVVNKMKAWQGSLGVSAHDGIVSPDYLVCTVHPGTHGRYLHHLLRSQLLISEFSRNSKGIRPSQWRLYWEDLSGINVHLPEIDTQRRIADFLDAETARLDRLISARTRQRDALDERVEAALNERLIPGAASAQHGASPWPWLPDLPPDRPLVRLGYVCRLQNGITIDGNRTISKDSITLPYLRVANVQAGWLMLGNVAEVTIPRSIADRSRLRPGDVLMTEGGDLNKLGRGTVWHGELTECLHQNHIFALRPNLDRLDGDYLALITRTVHGRCYFESTGSRTTNLASTNSSKILSFPIPLPSVEFQRKLARESTEDLATVSNIRTRLDHQRELLAERRQALITAAVTGQIDVSTASGRGIEDGLA